ncbi:hypothetical protein BDR04DRAFT_765198 [Suillus decipiens]|nr:hypothetical protein BDR04DRAFT_765198 [Suillus decipiens]
MITMSASGTFQINEPSPSSNTHLLRYPVLTGKAHSTDLLSCSSMGSSLLELPNFADKAERVGDWSESESLLVDDTDKSSSSSPGEEELSVDLEAHSRSLRLMVHLRHFFQCSNMLENTKGSHRTIISLPGSKTRVHEHQDPRHLVVVFTAVFCGSNLTIACSYHHTSYMPFTFSFEVGNSSQSQDITVTVSACGPS